MDDSVDPVLTKAISTWLGSGSINVFGRPYAGKDTQCKKIAELLGGEVIGSGDITRSQGSESLKKQSEAGFLAPTQEFRRLVLPYFSRDEYRDKPLILSSVGRWIGEEVPIIEAAKAAGHPIKVVIFISADVEVTWQRWNAAQQTTNRGERYDDDKEKLDVRLIEFQDKTLPVIEFYRRLGLLIEVDGSNDIKTVTGEILTKLDKFALQT